MNRIHKIFIAFISLLLGLFAFGQQTTLKGQVLDGMNKQPLPFAKIQFYNSKIGTVTDTLGNFYLQTYYATDSIKVSFSGYLSKTVKIQKDKEQELVIELNILSGTLNEVRLKAPDEMPSTRLHKRVIAYKSINNKEKLDAYEYELYNKIQLDLNNLNANFESNGLVKRLDVVIDFLDSNDRSGKFLPVVLSETVSDFYFKNNPKKKREVIKGTQITGIENLQVNQFFGDMYLDLNVYDNVYDMFNKSFISPLAPYARNFYKFYLEDSAFIDNDWCYKLRFLPKRKGDLTFYGEMWINDTTYAVKKINANLSDNANLNYIQDFYFEQEFDQVEKEVWMLTEEKIIAEFKLTKDSKIYGLYGRKYGSRRNFKVNTKREPEFYNSNSSIEIQDGAKNRGKSYWDSIRHPPLNIQEVKIGNMIDSLEKTPFFKTVKNFTYFTTTGYWPFGKFELGSAFFTFSYNRVEKFRTALALRTSNNFSRRVEFGGRLAYGFGDERFKYGGLVRYNITPKKRGMWSTYYNYDIEQIGQSPTAATVGSTFGTALNTRALDKLTFVTKVGTNLEKDIKKDIIVFAGAEWKEYTPLGLANYRKVNPLNPLDTLNSDRIKTTEFLFRCRWTKDEEFIAGSFDRTSMRSVYPILSLQAIIGVKGIMGSQYNYQKLEFQLEHNTQVGALGRMRYGMTAGYIFGNTAYPFLKVHEGNQSLWLLTTAFNKMNFLEFISDRYIMAFSENHWEGLLFDRLPGIKKLKLRLVTNVRAVYGDISDRHQEEMIIPDFVRRFGNIPYVEAAVGIENIAKFLRVDLVYRATHQIPNVSPLGILFRLDLYF